MSLSNQPFRPLPHRAGFEFDIVNPLINVWKDAWDGVHPLLDIGCGNCVNALQGIEAGAVVRATELNDESLNKLRDKYSDVPGLDFSYLELPNPIPFDDSSSSAVLVSEVFHFLDHDEVMASIRELHRVLVPGGVLAITCCCEDVALFQPLGIKALRQQQRDESPERMKAHEGIINLLERALELDPENERARELMAAHRNIQPKTYFNFFNLEQLADALSRSGFEVELAETGPADYYPLWQHGSDDQVRIIARKIRPQPEV